MDSPSVFSPLTVNTLRQEKSASVTMLICMEENFIPARAYDFLQPDSCDNPCHS